MGLDSARLIDTVEIEINGSKLQVFSNTTICNPYSEYEFQMASAICNGAIVTVYRVRGGEWSFLPPFSIGSAFLTHHAVDPF